MIKYFVVITCAESSLLRGTAAFSSISVCFAPRSERTARCRRWRLIYDRRMPSMPRMSALAKRRRAVSASLACSAFLLALSCTTLLLSALFSFFSPSAAAGTTTSTTTSAAAVASTSSNIALSAPSVIPATPSSPSGAAGSSWVAATGRSPAVSSSPPTTGRGRGRIIPSRLNIEMM